MGIVQYTHTPHQLRDLLNRVSLALACIPGVAIAQPPYHVPMPAVIGHGITAHQATDHTVITCFVCIDPALSRSLPEHCTLVQMVAHAVLSAHSARECSINVVITDLLA